MTGVRERAQELLAARLEVVSGLETATSRLAEARESVRDAEGLASTAWKLAVEAGWTGSELRKLGFVQPSTRRGGRPPAASRRLRKSDRSPPPSD